MTVGIMYLEPASEDSYHGKFESIGVPGCSMVWSTDGEIKSQTSALSIDDLDSSFENEILAFMDSIPRDAKLSIPEDTAKIVMDICGQPDRFVGNLMVDNYNPTSIAFWRGLSWRSILPSMFPTIAQVTRPGDKSLETRLRMTQSVWDKAWMGIEAPGPLRVVTPLAYEEFRTMFEQSSLIFPEDEQLAEFGIEEPDVVREIILLRDLAFDRWLYRFGEFIDSQRSDPRFVKERTVVGLVSG